MNDHASASGQSSVRLRAPEPEDLDLLYTIENDPSLWDVTDNPQPLSRYALRQYIANAPQTLTACGEMRLVIESTERNEAIGLLDLVNYNHADRRAEVCIALLKTRRGQGYGPAALHAAETYARQWLHLRLLFAQVAAERNDAARHLFTKAGYTAVATLPHWHRHQEDYENITIYQKIIDIPLCHTAKNT